MSVSVFMTRTDRVTERLQVERLQLSADVGVPLVEPVAEVCGAEEAAVQAHLAAAERYGVMTGGSGVVRGADTVGHRWPAVVRQGDTAHTTDSQTRHWPFHQIRKE